MSHNNQPKEIGSAWERRVADHFADAGLAYDRAPLRGRRDRLDIAGSLGDGFLIGAKAKTRRRVTGDQDRLSEAMREAADAIAKLPYTARSETIGVQILQRPGYGVGKAYAVMTVDDLIRVIRAMRELRALKGAIADARHLRQAAS